MAIRLRGLGLDWRRLADGFDVVVFKYVMSQVFAAINHRLSEEYSEIELPTPESKQRYVSRSYSYS